VLSGAFAITAAACTPRDSGEKSIKAEFDLSELWRAADRFRADHGREPSSLAELTSPSDGRPPYTDDRRDPWTGEPYRSRIDSKGRLEFYSLGSDMRPGGDSHRRDISTKSSETR